MSLLGAIWALTHGSHRLHAGLKSSETSCGGQKVVRIVSGASSTHPCNLGHAHGPAHSGYKTDNDAFLPPSIGTSTTSSV